MDLRLTTYASPRARNSPASEAMNGWTSKYWTRTPMTRPIAGADEDRERARPGTGDTPALSSLAHRIPVRASTDPTDRSMPPVTITNVMPTARISRKALSSSSADMFRGVTKLPK